MPSTNTPVDVTKEEAIAATHPAPTPSAPAAPKPKPVNVTREHAQAAKHA